LIVERRGSAERPMGVTTTLRRPAAISSGLTLAAVVGLLAGGCGTQGPANGTGPDSGKVIGSVLLGPQCPVEVAGEPCNDKPAAGVTVIVSEQLPGEAYAAGPEVARTTTDADGHFLVEVAAGDYIVTAEAGMHCELMDVRVVAGGDARVQIPCDTGIR
jgi:hypothetical protein